MRRRRTQRGREGAGKGQDGQLAGPGWTAGVLD